MRRPERKKMLSAVRADAARTGKAGVVVPAGAGSGDGTLAFYPKERRDSRIPNSVDTDVTDVANTQL